MRKRQQAAAEAYEAQWNNGLGSHHPDFDPEAPAGDGVVKASRPTEELYNAIVKNDIAAVYAKIEEGADANFVFGEVRAAEARVTQSYGSNLVSASGLYR